MGQLDPRGQVTPVSSPGSGGVRALEPEVALAGRAIVVVAGDPAGREQARRVLSEAGLRSLEAPDAIEALRRLSSHVDDVLFCAVELPFFDVADLARRARRLPAGDRVRIVAHGAPADRQRCLAAGCDAFVPDPVDWWQLPKLLAQVVATPREVLAREHAAIVSASGSVPPPVRADRDLSALMEEVERLRALSSQRAEFLQKLAHELSGPLTPLVGYAGMLKGGKLGEVTAQQAKALDAMSLATHKLEHGIEALVDYCALESGRYQVHREDVFAEALVKDVEHDAHARARHRHVRVELRVAPALVVSADARRLRQALSALLDHGLTQSPNGGNLLFDVTLAQGRVLFSVYDQGPVIADPLRLLSAQPHKGEDRPAPGLVVARQIAESHGGTLWLESPPHEQPETRDLFPGSKVVLALPAK